MDWTLTGAKLCDLAEETSYQYLSPDFAVDEEKSRDPMYFGSFDIMKKLTNTPYVKARLAATSSEPINFKKPDWIALTNAPGDWDVLKSCWRLERSGHFYLASKKLEEKGFGDEPAWTSVTNFSERLFGVHHGLMTEVLQIRANSPFEFLRLVTTYEYEWKTELRDGQFLVFSDFFDCWAAFSQVYIYVLTDVKMPKNPSTTSVHFEKVRSFYAIAQEFYARQIVLLTALNNIKDGRKFDELKSINLKKYRSTDNAKRRDNFKSHNIFDSISQEFDNGLRNAVAHNWISMLPDGFTLQYKEGGSGVIAQLPYIQYIFKCMSLFKQICLLMQVEYLLTAAAREAASERFLLKNTAIIQYE